MRRMLDPKEAGGSLPSTITFDGDGNRTVGKDLKVDGKLKLKSLVSASNPDGDITKELGGGGGKIKKYYLSSIHAHYIPSGTYKVGSNIAIEVNLNNSTELNKLPDGNPLYCEFSPYDMQTVEEANEDQPAFIVLGPQSYPSKTNHNVYFRAVCIKAGEVTGSEQWNRIRTSVVLWYQE